MELSRSGSKLVRSFRHIPGPISLPVIGTLYLYKLGIFNVLKYHEVLQHLYEKYGPISRENIGSSTLVHVFDPDDARIIYQNEGKMPHVVPLQETAQLYRQKAEMSLGLGNTNGAEWYRLRAAIRHLMLRPRDVQQYLPDVGLVARDLVSRLRCCRDEQGCVPDLATEIAKWAQESAGVVCFDRRLGYLSDGPQKAVIEQVIQANKNMFYLSGLLKFSLPVYKYIPTPKWKKIVEAEDIVVRTTLKYVNEALVSIETLAKENKLTANKFSFMTSLLAKENLSKKDIETLTFSLFVDGLSTTVPTVLHNLYSLATNPVVQDKAYREIQQVMGKDEVITSDHLSQFNYIKAVIKETFRMYPNGTEISRILQNDHVLSNYHIPAQTCVSINMGVHFRSPHYFSAPDQFRPERWLRGEKADNPHPYVLTPFGVGTRTCAGRRFAEQDMYVLLTEVVRTFQLSFEGTEPLDLEYNTLLLPSKPLRIRFTPRHS
ncbi:probable cytochrome P450 CYP44 [Macrosteles quadrilineatus]|uniref:probable cytochrome P450 CYP44 n=1 Tax=Macrosteles quadrilineatus TaxID=74068 RepID=UPI0023E0CE6A|nr:probable cytochrome P450 CYP44 [Macrosteles quadrilineatus]